MIILPWQSQVPDPRYIKSLENARVMLDIGTLLRAMLFEESHSRRLLEHIERASGASAVISPHVRDLAVITLKRVNPNVVLEFTSNLLAAISRGRLEVVPDGNPADLPAGVAFDAEDDDIVIATALSARCTSLATLDFACATHASQVLDIRRVWQRECNELQQTLTTIDVRLFAGRQEGSISLEVLPSGPAPGAGRHFVFATSRSLGLWLDGASKRYELGLVDRAQPIFRYRRVPLDSPTSIALSYDLTSKRIVTGIFVEGSNEAFCDSVPPADLPDQLGSQISIMSNGDSGHFPGFWRGILSAGKFIDVKPLRFALTSKHYFDPLDAQRFKLSDATFDLATGISSDQVEMPKT